MPTLESKSGLQMTTYAAIHRESEAKKNILQTPDIGSVLDQVKFEINELPEDLAEALAKC